MSRYQPSSKEQVTALLTTSFTTAVLLPFDFTKVTQQVLSFNKHNSEIQPWVVSRSAVSQLGL